MKRVLISFLVIPPICLFLLTVFLSGVKLEITAHNPGGNCLQCHENYSFGGTIFRSGTGDSINPGIPVELISPDGTIFTPDASDQNGNIYASMVSEGEYLIRIGTLRSRTWHQIPLQGACNTCHLAGGNGDEVRTVSLPAYHTAVTPGNQCTDCHHFPATMDYSRLKTEGALYPEAFQPDVPGSLVRISGTDYAFDPVDHEITTTRPDIFAEGYFSMFDVILAVAKQTGIQVDYHYDSLRKTHFITHFDGVEDDYWYHFSYDAGTNNSREITYRRQYRWDEALWRPGVWIHLVTGENLNEIKNEYLEEIDREKNLGNLIPDVMISINPSVYEGNPDGSGRVTVSKTFSNVPVAAHNYRATGYDSPYSKPFQPGVITSMDVLLSLADSGELTLVTGVFYDHFAGNYIDSYYIVEIGFPVEGIAHSSGRQGFVYTTGNGTNYKLVNEADNKFHITSDISVIHAPDFCRWRWIELGNSYYENEVTRVHDLIAEDYQSISRGFNLHPPMPNPVTKGVLKLRYNIFEQGSLRIELIDMNGKSIHLIKEAYTSDLGIADIDLPCEQFESGQYIILMRFNGHSQARNVIILNQ
jgi:hypothetical protein